MSLASKLAIVENYIEKQKAPSGQQERVGFMLRQLSHLIGSSKESGEVDKDFLEFLISRAKDNANFDSAWAPIADALSDALDKSGKEAIDSLVTALNRIKDMYGGQLA